MPDIMIFLYKENVLKNASKIIYSSLVKPSIVHYPKWPIVHYPQ